MPDVMNDEMLVERDISDPAMGFVLLGIVYVVIPLVLWGLSEWWEWRKRR